ncbi:hypothetical protein Hanom_Chr12g01130301 [Helianthus anomalus]
MVLVFVMTSLVQISRRFRGAVVVVVGLEREGKKSVKERVGVVVAGGDDGRCWWLVMLAGEGGGCW